MTISLLLHCPCDQPKKFHNHVKDNFQEHLCIPQRADDAPSPRILSGIIQINQDEMNWISRILVGEMAGAEENLGSEVGQINPIFWNTPAPNPTQHDLHFDGNERDCVHLQLN
jgi:hypothetical protein